MVWFPHNPYPARTGAHHRCLSLLAALRELDWSTVLLSSDLAHDPWHPESIAVLRERWVEDVRIYRLGSVEWRVRGMATRWSNLRAKLGRPSLDSWAQVPPGLRRWSRNVTDALLPELMLSSYAQYDPLVPHGRHPAAQSLIDTIDLVSVSQAMWLKLAPQLQLGRPLVTSDVAEEVLTEGFLDDAQAVAPREMHIYDRYSDTLAISEAEAERIRQGTSRSRVHFVPMTVAVAGSNTYDGRAVFVGGANPFNLQGLLWFARHVLPLVLKQARGFELDAVGETVVPWRPDPGITAWGLTDDLGPIYEHAAFAVCPLLAGTGQQVKIIDAMAHGVAVVAHRRTAATSPIVDGVNGYVAATAEEFADRVAMLWQDRLLCRSLGKAARDTIETEFAPSRTVAELSAILDRGPRS